MSDAAARLEATLLDLLGHVCVTGEEGPIADWLEARYRQRGEQVRRVGHSIVAGAAETARPRVLLVGHVDVVPPTAADREARVEADRIVGRGTSDMKSGLAVAMDCFEDTALRDGPFALQVVAYASEEGSHAGNELGPLLRAVDDLAAADLAVVLEPTDLTVQLGCMGALHAEITFPGRAAHSARPWQGENALTGAGTFLAALHDRAPEDVTVDGLVYREVMTATQAWTPAGHARNVVPDRFTVNVNYRFAPDKTVSEAEERVRELAGEAVEVAITDRAPAGRPRRDSELVEAFLRSVAAPVKPKQAWTDVARFSEIGVPALNYGPGLTAQAHQAGEYVPRENLHTARAALARFLGADPGERNANSPARARRSRR